MTWRKIVDHLGEPAEVAVLGGCLCIVSERWHMHPEQFAIDPDMMARIARNDPEMVMWCVGLGLAMQLHGFAETMEKAKRFAEAAAAGLAGPKGDS